MGIRQLVLFFSQHLLFVYIYKNKGGVLKLYRFWEKEEGKRLWKGVGFREEGVGNGAEHDDIPWFVVLCWKRAPFELCFTPLVLPEEIDRKWKISVGEWSNTVYKQIKNIA